MKYLIFPLKIKLSVFSIQGPLHSNKLVQQIFKDALQKLKKKKKKIRAD